MTINKVLTIILGLSILLRLLLIINYSQIPHFEFHQEGYTNYIEALKKGSINTPAFGNYETRLFPGYILIILPFTFLFGNVDAIGVVLNLFLFTISFILIWKIFRNVFINFLFAFFPPIWIMQIIKASSEPLTVTLLLTSIYLFIKKYYFSVGLVLGLAFSVRTITFCLLLGIVAVLFFEKKVQEIAKLLIGFLATAILLILYNYLVFGTDHLFMQFTNLDQNLNGATIGFIQIFKDILRTVDWKEYKILFSGIFYLIINFASLLIIYKFRNKSEITKICFYWVLFSIIFILTVSPHSLIENFGRYSIPFLPAVCVAIDLSTTYLDENSGFLRKLPKFSANQKRMKTHK